MKSNAVIIGENIRLYRKRAGLTQKKLAEIVGVNYLTIGRYENGQLEPRSSTLERIAEALSVSPTLLRYDLSGYDWSKQTLKTL